MPERLTPQQFMLAPREVRDYMADIWGINQSAGSEVVDGVQVSDGHTYQDLAVITKELLCDYIGSEESFLRAWEIAVSAVTTELHPPTVTLGAVPNFEKKEDVVDGDTLNIEPKKRGRPAKTE